MFRFFKIFQNFGTSILFIFLECICLFLIIRYNKGHNEIFLHSSNEITSSIVKQRSRLKQSLDLMNQNDELLNQNAKLIEELVNHRGWTEKDSSINAKKYEIMSATIINSSIHSLSNYITLDRGLNDNMYKGMGVIGDKGIVGVINQVTPKYSTAISMLNVDLRIAAGIRDKDYAGYLAWSGENYFHFNLYGIPKHAEITIGDEVITSGHSSIFPKGLSIGKIEEYSVVEGGAFYDISVDFNQDLTNVSLVYVIINNDFEEIRSLERLNEN